MSLEETPREKLETRRAELLDELENVNANSDVPMQENEDARRITGELVELDRELENN